MTPTTADRAPARLRSSSVVSSVVRSGRRRASGSVVVHVAPGIDGSFRFTAVASRRIGTAVERNRAKRLIREAVRGLPWVDGVDAVVVARPSIVGAHRDRVRADVLRAGQDLEVMA